MSLHPTNLELQRDDTLVITWNDGQVRQYSFGELREKCPCATCREKRAAAEAPALLPVLTAAQLQPLRIIDMQPVGNYAYSIVFSDGHDTGIFTLDFLRELGTAQQSR